MAKPRLDVVGVNCIKDPNRKVAKGRMAKFHGKLQNGGECMA